MKFIRLGSDVKSVIASGRSMFLSVVFPPKKSSNTEAQKNM